MDVQKRTSRALLEAFPAFRRLLQRSSAACAVPARARRASACELLGRCPRPRDSWRPGSLDFARRLCAKTAVHAGQSAWSSVAQLLAHPGGRSPTRQQAQKPVLRGTQQLNAVSLSRGRSQAIIGLGSAPQPLASAGHTHHETSICCSHLQLWPCSAPKTTSHGVPSHKAERSAWRRACPDPATCGLHCHCKADFAQKTLTSLHIASCYAASGCSQGITNVPLRAVCNRRHFTVFYARNPSRIVASSARPYAHLVARHALFRPHPYTCTTHWLVTLQICTPVCALNLHPCESCSGPRIRHF